MRKVLVLTICALVLAVAILRFVVVLYQDGRVFH